MVLRKKIYVFLLQVMVIFTIFCGSFLKINELSCSGFYFIFSLNFSIVNLVYIFLLLFLLYGGFVYVFAAKRAYFILNILFSISSIVVIALSKAVLINLKIIDIKEIYFSFSSLFCVLFFMFYMVSSIPKIKIHFKIKVIEIVEVGILIALSIIFSLPFFKIRINANGGSISLTMLPLMVLCLRHRFPISFLACGLIYGFIDCSLDGYGFIFFPFDYLLGYGSISLISLFRKNISAALTKKNYFKSFIFLFISVLLVFTCRTLASSISSIVFYQYSFLEALIYQFSYLPLSFIACYIFLMIGCKKLIRT